MLAVIGGSGLERIGISTGPGRRVDTPFGEPSAALAEVSLAGAQGQTVLFLARHGSPHSVAPHRINYRANVWALRKAGADRVVAVNSVGSLRREWSPGSVVLPDQLIDYTWGREHTFAGPDEPVRHLDFSHPYTPQLRSAVIDAAKRTGTEIVDGAVYGCTQGPRFETPAEIARLGRDGCDLVGMTGMPEAILAREAGLEYCSISVVGNPAAGLGGPGQVLVHEQVATATAAAMDAVRAVLAALAATG